MAVSLDLGAQRWGGKIESGGGLCVSLLVETGARDSALLAKPQLAEKSTERSGDAGFHTADRRRLTLALRTSQREMGEVRRWPGVEAQLCFCWEGFQWHTHQEKCGWGGDLNVSRFCLSWTEYWPSFPSVFHSDWCTPTHMVRKKRKNKNIDGLVSNTDDLMEQRRKINRKKEVWIQFRVRGFSVVM